MNEPTYNLIGGKHIINEQMWAVSLVRKKAGQGAEHAFLLIEGFKGKDYKAIRADLFIKQNTPLESSAISGESGLKTSNYSGHASAKVLPGSSGNCVLYASHASGKSQVAMKDLMIKDMQALANECECKTYGIPKAKAELLIQNITTDLGVDMGYNLCGDGSSYSCSFTSQKYLSSVNWAMEKLKEIDIEAKGTWYDFIIKITSNLTTAVEVKLPTLFQVAEGNIGFFKKSTNTSSNVSELTEEETISKRQEVYRSIDEMMSKKAYELVEEGKEILNDLKKISKVQVNNNVYMAK